MKLHPLSPAVHAFAVVGLVLARIPVQAQIILNNSTTSNDLVQNTLLGQGVEVSNVTFNRSPGNVSAGNNGWGSSDIGRFNGENTVLGINGVYLCTGIGSLHIPGPNDELMMPGGGFASAGGGMPQQPTPDVDLSRLTGWPGWETQQGSNIHSKAVLEFDFVPDNDMVSFRYVFSSEEYERWVCSQYNDVFGWFISGPGISGPFTNNAMNIAFIPGSMAPVCINAVNSGRIDSTNANGSDWRDPCGPCFAADSNWQANAQYYRYNGGQWTSPGLMGSPQLEAPYNNDPYYIQHNGLTVALTASAAVRIGQTYHMKMGVANVGDAGYPSAVFIEQNSFRSSDRFTLTVDEGPNVDLNGTGPILHESDVDSVFLRFNRWGGFYLDEYLRIAIGGDAMGGVDYQPALPDSIHFNQLDSAVVVALALPVRNSEPRGLDISLITSNGDKVMTFPLTIAQELSVGMAPARRASELTVFPNPAQNTLHVALPPDTKGRTQVQVLDMAGRVVAEQVLNGATKATFDLTGLPDGLYTLKADTNGRVATIRVSVRH